MEIILKLLGEAKVEIIVLIVMGLNILLSAVGQVLDMVKDKTPSDGDNKAAGIVHKLLGYSQSALDFLGANRKHK